MVHKRSHKQLNKTIDFKSELDKTISEIQKIIDNDNKNEFNINKQQLIKVKEELIFMSLCNNKKKIIPSFPRMIIDSWDYNNPLGIKLLKLYESYKKIK